MLLYETSCVCVINHLQKHFLWTSHTPNMVYSHLIFSFRRYSNNIINTVMCSIVSKLPRYQSDGTKKQLWDVIPIYFDLIPQPTATTQSLLLIFQYQTLMGTLRCFNLALTGQSYLEYKEDLLNKKTNPSSLPVCC